MKGKSKVVYQSMLIFFLSAVWSIFPALWAHAQNQGLNYGVDLTSSLEMYYDTPGNYTRFKYPLHGSFSISYIKGIVEFVSSLNYNGSFIPGESYCSVNQEKSTIILGYVDQNWGVAYTVEPLQQWYRPDNSYPANIFNLSKRLPSPIFEISMGKSDTSVNSSFVLAADTLQFVNPSHIWIGLRGSWQSGKQIVSLGMIRRAGYPPPSFFIQSRKSSKDTDIWTEFEWRYWRKSKDTFNGVLGVKKAMGKNTGILEWVTDGTHSFIYGKEETVVNESINGNLEVYLHVQDWSNAWGLSVSSKLEKTMIITLGGYIFCGKSGGYLSPSRSDNDDSIYLSFSASLK